MKVLKVGKEAEGYRNGLVQFLNQYGLNGRAILAMVRRSKAYTYAPSELIVEQGKRSRHVFFLVTGSVIIHVKEGGRDVRMGEQPAITMLGEIAFFNNTPATATAKVADSGPAIVFRLGYGEFREIIDRFPDVRRTLARIGDLRMIRQRNGYIGFRMFMDMIGWRKDRFAVNRAFSADLENTVKLEFMPRLKKSDKILEVGDGPGLVSEIIFDSDPEKLDALHLLVSNLEASIANPGAALPSDFLRAGSLKHKFGAIVALQVFNVASRAAVEGQFQCAHNLLKKGGLLFAVKSQTVDITHDTGSSGNLIFNSLEELVEKHWPGAGGSKSLIDTTFLDADLDPIMEWNGSFCKKVVAGELKIPPRADKEERVLLKLLLGQAKLNIFDPEELHYRWLEWKAGECGFKLLSSGKNPENPFFYHLLQKI